MDRESVTWQGVTEEDALASLLCGVKLDSDRQADLLKAAEVIKDRTEWDPIRYQVVLHALHAELGTWSQVAARIGKPLSTVYNWAHRTGGYAP